MFLRAILAVLALLSAPASIQCLSPPWWVTYKMFNSFLQHDPCLNTSDLVAPDLPGPLCYSFNITACPEASADKLTGLATYLTQRYNFGGTLFMSHVLDSDGHRVHPSPLDTSSKALKLLSAALAGNKMFNRTAISRPWPCIPFYWAVFRPEIIQVWIDNLADLWGNTNLLAADMAERVLRLDRFGIRTSTLPMSHMKLLANGAAVAGEAELGLEAAGGSAGEGWEARAWRQRTLAAAALAADWQPLGSRQREVADWQCWPVWLAARMGGELAALKVQSWMFS